MFLFGIRDPGYQHRDHALRHTPRRTCSAPATSRRALPIPDPQTRQRVILKRVLVIRMCDAIIGHSVNRAPIRSLCMWRCIIAVFRYCCICLWSNNCRGGANSFSGIGARDRARKRSRTTGPPLPGCSAYRFFKLIKQLEILYL